MSTLLIVLFFVLWISLILYSISWVVHRGMVRDHLRTWDYASFDKFQEKFKAVKWKREEDSVNSYFTDSRCSLIHAGIIKFDNKGMVINYFYFWKLLLFLHRNRLNRREKGLWG